MDKPKQEKEQLQAADFFGSLNTKILSFFMGVLLDSGPIEDVIEATRRERQANTFFFNLINGIEDGAKRALIFAAARKQGILTLLDPSEDWSALVQWDETGSVTAFSFPFFDWGFNEANPWEIRCRFMTLWIDLLEAGASEEFLSQIGQGSSRLCEYCDQHVTLEQIQSGDWSFGRREGRFFTEPVVRGRHINHKH